jgi:SAM-dependent methyltransferase
MKQDARSTFDLALRRARLSAYPAGEFVGQESFMRASEILSLAERAGIDAGVTVLDLCCGVAGPGLLIARELQCRYVGVDSDPCAIRIARDRAGSLDCRFEICQVPPVPREPSEVVLLLETMLAFPDKETLVAEIANVLPVGGRFAFTFEEGRPLTEAERATMPAADTVWLIPLAEMLACLGRAGLRVCWRSECTDSHRLIVESLLDEFAADAGDIGAQLGRPVLDALMTAHRHWSDWFRAGRVRKFAVVAQKTAVAGDG